MPPVTPPRRPPLLGYQRLRLLVVALLVMEFVVGMVGYLTPQKEIFPLASWFLFLLVPHDTSDYDLLLRAANGVPIDPPRPYSQALALVATPHSIVTYQLVQQFGEAVALRDDTRSRSLRRQIEGQFLVARTQYDLVRNTYQPVERWETGQVRARRTLQSFTAGQP